MLWWQASEPPVSEKGPCEDSALDPTAQTGTLGLDGASNKGSCSNSISSSIVRGPHISRDEMENFDPRTHGSWEDFILRRWTTGRRLHDPENVDADMQEPTEYAEARRLICLRSSLMQGSRVGRTMLHLERARSLRRDGDSDTRFRGTVSDVLGDFYDVFEPALLLVLKKAFGLRTDVAARNEHRPVPIVADFSGNFFDAAVIMWAALPLWKKPIMSQSLRELFITEDPTGLQVVLGMIKESVLHCSAGKVDVWSRMLLRVAPPAPEMVVSAFPGSIKDYVDSLDQFREQAQHCLWEEALAFVDDWKEKVFSTVFLEPTKMYYVACREKDLADNVEVHGASVYLAVLLGALGVRCPRLPFLLDTPISAVSFLDSLDEEQIAELWRPENLGKPFAGVPECRKPRVTSRILNHHSNFIFNGRQPWTIANSAIDSKTSAERKLKLQPYLERFAYYFSEEILLPRLTQHLLQLDSTRHALQVIFEQHRNDSFEDTDQKKVKDESAEQHDVRLWLWDLEVLPAKFRAERARKLLSFAGLLK